MILLYGGVLASGEKAPMEAFCLRKDSSMDLNALCDIELDQNLVYSKFFTYFKLIMFQYSEFSFYHRDVFPYCSTVT